MDTAQKRPPTDVEIQALPFGHGWTIRSTCGVVKVWSSRDGCMIALAPSEARQLGRNFALAMELAADTTEIRSYGEIVSRSDGAE